MWRSITTSNVYLLQPLDYKVFVEGRDGTYLFQDTDQDNSELVSSVHFFGGMTYYVYTGLCVWSHHMR